MKKTKKTSNKKSGVVVIKSLGYEERKAQYSKELSSVLTELEAKYDVGIILALQYNVNGIVPVINTVDKAAKVSTDEKKTN